MVKLILLYIIVVLVLYAFFAMIITLIDIFIYPKDWLMYISLAGGDVLMLIMLISGIVITSPLSFPSYWKGWKGYFVGSSSL